LRQKSRIGNCSLCAKIGQRHFSEASEEPLVVRPHLTGVAEHLIKKGLRIVTLEQVTHEISSLIARSVGEKKK
jgi:hypothetical protein